jgi:hypothetical protein
LAVFVNHRIPTDSVIGRLDQRKREVAQGALVLGEIVERDWRTGARRGFLTDPGVDVVGDDRLLQPAEIADAGIAGSWQQSKDDKSQRRCAATSTCARSAAS